jgi:hypothetical protein
MIVPLVDWLQSKDPITIPPVSQERLQKEIRTPQARAAEEDPKAKVELATDAAAISRTTMALIVCAIVGGLVLLFLAIALLRRRAMRP